MKPNSFEEKKGNIKERWLFVHELKSFLEEFDDDDWVEVNKVGNLNVMKAPDGKIWSTIDLHFSRLEHWFEEEE